MCSIIVSFVAYKQIAISLLQCVSIYFHDICDSIQENLSFLSLQMFNQSTYLCKYAIDCFVPEFLTVRQSYWLFLYPAARPAAAMFDLPHHTSDQLFMHCPAVESGWGKYINGIRLPAFFRLYAKIKGDHIYWENDEYISFISDISKTEIDWR